MTQEIEKIKQALADATPGLWEKWGSNGIHHVRQVDTRQCVADGVMRTYDAHFIANAPTWLASLITTIESLQAENERLKIAVQIDVSLGNTVCEMHEEIESQKEEIKDLKTQSKSHYNHFLQANDEADVLLKKVESLQKDSRYLRKLLSDLRPLLSSKLSEDAVNVVQKEIDFALSHIQEGNGIPEV